MLEYIRRRFENQTQYDKDLTFTETRHATQTTDMKASIQHNNRTETTSDCTVNLNTINTPQNDKAVGNK